MSKAIRNSSRKSNTVQGFLLYRIWYGDYLVYVGRTKQPLQDRIRGHLFAKPMHRILSIQQITKIEYASFQTEADMNLYEIYFILLWHPTLNVDDKTRDFPTVELPPVEWSEFETPLWEKWRSEIVYGLSETERKSLRLKELHQMEHIVRSSYRQGEIPEYDMRFQIDAIKEERSALRRDLYDSW